MTQPVEAACGGDGLPRMFISLGCAAGHVRLTAVMCRGAVVNQLQGNVPSVSSAQRLHRHAIPRTAYDVIQLPACLLASPK